MTTALTLSPMADIQSYIQQANQFPILSAEHEHQLACQLAEHGDLEAAKTLIMSNLRFVIMIARGYQGYGLPQADLIQEGNVGLMKAVKRFEPEQGVRLMTFAVYWIKAEIHEYVFRNWRMLKTVTTKAQRKLFFNLRKYKKSLHWFNSEEVKEVATELQVSEQDVREMESRMVGQDVSLLQGEDADYESSGQGVFESSLEAETASPEMALIELDWQAQAQQQLLQKFTQLDDRSQLIIQRRWLDEEKATLHELAEILSISHERVRQLEKQALEKLKRQLAN
ncbi:RNA polymerase sigma factor RpoH [Motilimonas pumila]|uniref:RNA polymerase sigma factor n=1 Tax=Motilimonas pumila TaxID=2303987 RepID=A0A418YHG9_9GAMM|nr:RNA polymerase sigma factor RpoH [Motilimonas pumila]RJG49399.1 RNA polymerase sigma factor RpoH [Motilimonas pumila]